VTPKKPAPPLPPLCTPLAVAVVYNAQHINAFAARNWRLFSHHDYFQPSGQFVSALVSAPLLLAQFVILLNYLAECFELLVEMKRKEFVWRARERRRAEQTSKEPPRGNGVGRIDGHFDAKKSRWMKHKMVPSSVYYVTITIRSLLGLKTTLCYVLRNLVFREEPNQIKRKAMKEGFVDPIQGRDDWVWKHYWQQFTRKTLILSRNIDPIYQKNETTSGPFICFPFRLKDVALLFTTPHAHSSFDSSVILNRLTHIALTTTKEKTILGAATGQGRLKRRRNICRRFRERFLAAVRP
jgi:hypothetical protein